LAHASTQKVSARERPLAVGLSDGDHEALAARRARRRKLEQAVTGVPGDDVVSSLHQVATTIPPAAEVETVGIWVRATDGDRLFHLLAFEGSPSHDFRRIALEAVNVGRARSLAALGAHHSLARNLGLRWVGTEWMKVDSETVGLVTLGSRTQRRPAESDRIFLAAVVGGLAARVAPIDRRSRTLRALARRITRDSIAMPDEEPESALGALRPRERVIIDLYADGLRADEIAEILVISPHTVRTHIKHAFRRLGVHSREEAARLAHEERVLKLL
jgi:DNA-binding CsgD family transcriptional regulator